MKDKKAFTLAETMIVLVILGIVAAITIPALVRNQMEAQNRTRIKKAMTVYDMALNKMVVENNLKSNDALYSNNQNDNRAFAPQGNCTRTSAYFKINRTLDDDNGTNCRFCSSDNVCWDISNILKPIIGIGEEGITNENSTNRYRMFAHFGDNGELRVDDVAYEQNHNYLTDDEKEELVALYNFTNNKKSSGGDKNENKESELAKKCKSGEITCTKKTLIDKQVSNRCGTNSSSDDENCGTLCIWDSEKEEEICSYTSTATAGEYYFTEPATYEAYESYLDPTSSTCQECKDYGMDDFYNAAKRYCEAQGGRLPTIGELLSGGFTDGEFPASEEYSSDRAYILNSGYMYSYDKQESRPVVCIGD